MGFCQCLNTERSPQHSPLGSQIVYPTSSGINQAAGGKTQSGFSTSKDVRSLVQELTGPGSQEAAVCPENKGKTEEVLVWLQNCDTEIELI